MTSVTNDDPNGVQSGDANSDTNGDPNGVQSGDATVDQNEREIRRTARLRRKLLALNRAYLRLSALTVGYNPVIFDWEPETNTDTNTDTNSNGQPHTP